jgi:hypothetical protein
MDVTLSRWVSTFQWRFRVTGPTSARIDVGPPIGLPSEPRQWIDVTCYEHALTASGSDPDVRIRARIDIADVMAFQLLNYFDGYRLRLH